MVAYRKILFATDFSPASEQALEMAETFNRVFGATVDIVQVFDPTAFKPPKPYSLTSNLADWLEKNLSKLQERSKSSLRGMGTHFHAEIRTHYIEGKPGRRIVALAQELGSDLIIMGTCRRTGLDHFFVGSVARFVRREAACAVLTVRPK